MPQRGKQFDYLSRIDRYAEICPNGVAFVGSGRSLTYLELKKGSDAVAGYLAGTLPQDDSPVAVLGHKEPEMPVAFLGAAKSGHPYVPIDISLPQGRIDRILSVSGAKATLTPELVAQISKAPSQVPVLDLPDSHPYYVIFTSGSTGEPKGVVITRGCLAVFLNWMLAEHRFKDQDEVFLNQAPFSFDLSVMDLYLGMATGSTVASVARADMADPERLRRRLSDSGITVWVSTPSFAEMCLVDSRFRAEMLPRLRKFLFCGETLAPHLAAMLFERFPQAEVWNTYGPTETTVATTSIQITPAILRRHDSLPVGYSMPAGRIVIHDGDGSSVADGERGELVIVGPNVSPGYLNRPDLTEKVFFDFEGERAYRTGDWGRSVGGLLFYEGRRDRQVKLRGYRIELSEIERQLRALPDLCDALVLPVTRHDRVESLAAYVVVDPTVASQSDLARSIKSRLSGQLPEYMVPGRVFLLDYFPMTPNGKVDVKALPEVEDAEGEQIPAAGPQGASLSQSGEKADATGMSSGSGTPAQETLRAIWCDILGRKRVGLRDNFFDLGGHSLAAVRLVARIEKAFGKKIPISAIFQWPTIEQLGATLHDVKPGDSSSLLLRLRPTGSRPPFFWIHGDWSNITLPLLLPEDQPIYGMMHQGHDGSRAEFKTVESIASHYLPFLRSVQPHGPYFLGGFSFGGLVAFEMAQQLVGAGEQVALLFLADPDRLQLDDWSTQAEEIQPRGEGIMDNSRRHLRTILRMPAGQIHRYIWSRVGDRLNRLVWIRMVRLRNRAICAGCDLIGLRIPAFLRSYYILDVYRRAAAVYIAKKYPGSIVLMAGVEASRSLPLWKDVASGGLSVRETPGDHLDIIKGPDFRHLAEELGRFLAGAQSRSVSLPIAVPAGNFPEVSEANPAVEMPVVDADRNRPARRPS